MFGFMKKIGKDRARKRNASSELTVRDVFSIEGITFASVDSTLNSCFISADFVALAMIFMTQEGKSFGASVDVEVAIRSMEYLRGSASRMNSSIKGISNRALTTAILNELEERGFVGIGSRYIEAKDVFSQPTFEPVFGLSHRGNVARQCYKEYLEAKYDWLKLDAVSKDGMFRTLVKEGKTAMPKYDGHFQQTAKLIFAH